MQELAEACLATKKRELSQQKGDDFDRAYMTLMVLSHVEMVDKLTVFKRHATPELQRLIDQGMQTTQTHLDHARKLMKSIEGIPHNSESR